MLGFIIFTFCYFSQGIINGYARHCSIHWQSTNTVANVRRHCYHTLQTKILESKRWDVLTRYTIKKSGKLCRFLGQYHDPSPASVQKPLNKKQQDKMETDVMQWSVVGINLKSWIKDEKPWWAFIIFEEKQLDILNLFEYPLLSEKMKLALRITFPKPFTVSVFERSSCQWRKPVRGWWLCLHSVGTPEELDHSHHCNIILSFVAK